MRLKFLLLLLLFLCPTLAFAGCFGCNKYRFCGGPNSWCYPRMLPGWWLNVEYLLLWRQKRFYPPLATTNVLGNDPILGEPGTEVLFGDQYLRKSPKSAARADVGLWVTPCLGVGGGGWGVKDEKLNFFDQGFEGNPIIGRPFFDVFFEDQEVFLVSSPNGIAPLPGPVSGSIDISTLNSMCGGDAYVRYRFLASKLFKFDLLGGAMMVGINDRLDVNSSTQGADNAKVILRDHFNCTNTFYAGLIGLIAEVRTCNWGLFFTGKVGLGNMVKRVTIEGSTEVVVPALGTITNFDGGLLALPSNIGRHGQNGFQASAQLSGQVQLRIWDHFWFTVGYTYMYWPKIALAGEQVDLNVNTSQLFGGTLIGPAAPLFNFRNKSFFLQGVTAGLYILF